MSDQNNLNRPSLKYSNYFNDPPAIPPSSRATLSPKSPEESTKTIETATWILLGLCCIPFLGGLFALATIVLGIILITRDKLAQGLIAVIVAPVASTAITMFVFLYFVAAAGTAAADSLEKQIRALPTPPPIILRPPPSPSYQLPPPKGTPVPTPIPRLKTGQGTVNGQPVR